MAVKEIVQKGHPALSKKCSRITKIDEDVLRVVQDLKDTLYSTDNGVGLSAPQINVLKRIIFIDTRDGMEPLILINPIIASKCGKRVSEEGCLSYPGYYGLVRRPEKVIVRGLNEKGEKVQIRAQKLLCSALCHEIDHLDGIMFYDRAFEMHKEDEEDE